MPTEKRGRCEPEQLSHRWCDFVALCPGEGTGHLRYNRLVPANLHPADGPRSRTSRAEVAVYQALAKHLPVGWSAWHSLRLRVGRDWEGEGDFVVAAPDRGLLVIEVKGGQVELRGGRWLQNGREMAMAPRQQALGFVRHLADALRSHGAEIPPYGVACAFPDLSFSDAPDCADLDGLVIGQREIDWLGDCLPRLLDRALPTKFPIPRNQGWVATLTTLWGETWVPHVRLADQAASAARRAVALDAEQLRLLDFAGENPRALVEGGAGTGKTVVARELGVRRARTGQRVLYTCFTNALARSVAQYFGAVEAPARPAAAAIRELACDLLRKSGHTVDPTSKDFWNQVAVQAACDALPPPTERPHLVIVDEAQDFDECDWMLVEALVEDRSLWVFRDPRQQFWSERALPKRETSFPLFTLLAQHRNPETVESFARLYVRSTDPTPPPATAQPAPEPTTPPPEPEALRLVVVPEAKVLDRVRHEIDGLIRAQVAPGDVAVLSLAGQQKSKLITLGKLGTHHLARADATDASTNIVADTFLRFKGLERPFIIITELVSGPKMKYDTRMHIALTRATAGVIIVCDEQAEAEDPRLGKLAGRGQ